MRRVVHITAHMGGGVGRALSSLLCFFHRNDPVYEHELLILEDPVDPQYLNLCRETGVAVRTEKDIVLEEYLSGVDIIQIEWWHHPLLYRFMKKLYRYENRIVIWAHVSGCTYPWISPKLVALSDQFVFTSPYSYENPFWSKKEDGEIRDKSTVISSCGDMSDFLSIPIKSRGDFVVGYIGTLSYAKLHPLYAAYCHAISDYVDQFIIIGDDQDADQLKGEIEDRGLWDKFLFTGHTRNVAKYLEKIDVLAYLLNENHYGTTENALLEAMATGAVPLVFHQCTEKYIVEHGVDGYCIADLESFKDAVRILKSNPLLLERMSSAAKVKIDTMYSLEKTSHDFMAIYDEMISRPKIRKDFDQIFGKEASDWFANGLAEDQVVLKELIALCRQSSGGNARIVHDEIVKIQEVYTGKSKASIPQFSRYCPEDPVLRYLAEAIEKINEASRR